MWENSGFTYKKNLFGDITAIYQGLVKVAEYTYDAWGNCTITYDPDGYGASNPIRYRDYYWDSDLGMYYLMTRYYDPTTGRFINADSFEYLNPKTINGLNLYSYCNNNPVINIDPMGTFSYTCWDEDGGDDLNAETFKSFGGGGMYGTNITGNDDNIIVCEFVFLRKFINLPRNTVNITGCENHSSTSGSSASYGSSSSKRLRRISLIHINSKEGK